MSCQVLRLNDYGGIIQITLVDCDGNPQDFSSAISKYIRFKKPNGEYLITGTDLADAEWVTNGSDGKLKYTIEEDIIDELGQWQFQAYVVGSDYAYASEISSFLVRLNLVSS